MSLPIRREVYEKFNFTDVHNLDFGGPPWLLLHCGGNRHPPAEEETVGVCLNVCVSKSYNTVIVCHVGSIGLKCW